MKFEPAKRSRPYNDETRWELAGYRNSRSLESNETEEEETRKVEEIFQNRW